MSRGDHLGELEELVLLTVLRLADEAYGGRIQDDLAKHAARSVSISTVYVTLMRLEEKGLLTSQLGDPTAVRGGKAKRYYEVRPEGVSALRRVREIRERLWSDVELEERHV